MNAKQEKNWAIACHLSSLLWIPLSMAGLVIPFTNLLPPALMLMVGLVILFTNLIAPAIIWYLKKDESELVDAHGKESLNFQISMTIYGLVAGIILVLIAFICMILVFGLGTVQSDPLAVFFGVMVGVVIGVMAGFGLVIGIALLAAIAIFQLLVVIFAAIKAKNGEIYRYPFNLRLL